MTRALLLFSALALAAPQAGCRCSERPPACRLSGEPVTLPTASSDPRLVTLAQDRRWTAAAWLEGSGDEAAVVVAKLNAVGRPVREPLRLGSGGPPPLMAALALYREQMAVLWMAGTAHRARLRGALISGKQVRTLEVAPPGKLTDPDVEFVGRTPWAVWAAGGAIWARAMDGSDDSRPTRLVDAGQDAFWPLLERAGNDVLLTYVTASAGYDLWLTRARTIAGLARGSPGRIPGSRHLRRLEPALARDEAGAVVAWSRVTQNQTGSSHQVLAARVTPEGQLVRYPGQFPGLGPAVAPSPGGEIAVAWLRPLTPAKGQLFFGLFTTSGAKPQRLSVEGADLSNGRPALARVAGGYTLMWVRPSGSRRELRAVHVSCRP
jgi:hypothetical protein